jgi:hypothetical protein
MERGEGRGMKREGDKGRTKREGVKDATTHLESQINQQRNRKSSKDAMERRDA